MEIIRHFRKAPPSTGVSHGPIPAADLTEDGEWRDHHLPIRGRDGKTYTWKLRARELSWQQIQALAEKHTTIVQVGRRQQPQVNQTALTKDILSAMIDGPRCDPPIPDLGQLRIGPLLAILHYFGLDQEGNEEVEREAGESDAP